MVRQAFFVICIVLLLASSTETFGDDEEEIRLGLESISESNSLILDSLEILTPYFQWLDMAGEDRKAEREAKQKIIVEKREKWRKKLDRLEKDIAVLVGYYADEANTDKLLENLSGEVLDNINNQAETIKTGITEMKKFLDTSLSGVDTVLTSVKKSAVSRNVKVAGVVLYGGIGSACIYPTDCVVANSECRQGICQCNPGLSFDSLRNTCQDDCLAYGTTYQFAKNKIIAEFNNLELQEKTLDECKRECERDDLGFICRSIDYFPLWKKCFLSEHTRSGVPDSSWIYNGAGIHFQRDCSYTE